MSDFPIPTGTLVVSCQSRPGVPLQGPEAMTLLARAAVYGGATGIRANGPADITAIRAAVSVPIIGLHKVGVGPVYLTPSVRYAAAVVAAGADIVAVDGTMRSRPDGTTAAEQIRTIRERFGVPVLADVDSVEAALWAREAGAAAVATTLSGYTGGQTPDEPDLDLVAALVRRLDCPVVAEGRYRTGAQVRAALDAGATAVVVGTAITDPAAITARLIRESLIS